MNTKTLSILLVTVAFAVMLHQFVTWGTWWSWDQVLHHEVLAVGLVAVATGLMVKSNWRKNPL